MTTATNAENLRQYKSRISLIIEQILAFPFRIFRVKKHI